jgi:uncharacterized protein YecE (DUF72 family)
VELHVGTSGYSYKEWKGRFYPEKLKAAEMLAFYAGRFGTVEINNTFYRMPRPELLQGWAAEVAANPAFVFVLKAPQRITHVKRLLPDAAEDLGHFVSTARVLGARLGPLLFQLPPFLKKDVARLRSFLGLLPADVRAAFEFRHESWFDDEVYAALREAGAALVVSDTDETPPEGPPLVPAADFGYLRLRRSEYDDAALARWRARIAAQPWRAAFVFFKHEDEGRGPELAVRFLEAAPLA